MRIIAGTCKGRRINAPKSIKARPTTDFAKEGLFNVLNNITTINKMKVLDLFAGTGSLGIEAISRGAQNTVFIESNKERYRMLKNSVHELNMNDKSMILFKDGLAWIKENNLSDFDLIFLDPPFNENYEKKVLDILKKKQNLKSSCKIYVEFSKFTKVEIPDSFTISKEKTLGDVKALLLNNDN